MPQVEIAIGGRTFEVACQDGEEHYLQAAAKMLDVEAASLSGQIGRMPEARMLLMAGLMLADKTVGLEERVHEAETQMAQMRAKIEDLSERPAIAPIPADVTDAMAELAAQAEAIASDLEKRTG